MLAFLAWLPLIGFITALIAGPFVFHRCRKREIVSPMVLLFIGTIMFFFVSSAGGKAIARRQVRNELKKVSAGEYSLLLNGRPVANPDELLSELAQIERHAAHHSHPLRRTHAVSIVLVADGTPRLQIKFCRDSHYKYEYWVYYDAFSTRAEIGSLNTRLFADRR